MADLIYNFIRNYLIGSESAIAGADDLATILTWTTLVLFTVILIKLVKWAFGIPFSAGVFNGRRN